MEDRAEVVKTIIEKVSSMLNLSDLSEESVYSELGMKSVNYSALINVLEDAFDIEINYMEFKRKSTIGESADFVAELIDG